MSEILNETIFSMFGSEVLLALESPGSEDSDEPTELTVEEVDEQLAEVIAHISRPRDPRLPTCDPTCDPATRDPRPRYSS